MRIGKDHGVFLRGADGNVARFLHKQTIPALRARGAVNDHECVDIDTGAVAFSPKMLVALYHLISVEGSVDEEAFRHYANERAHCPCMGIFCIRWQRIRR